MPACCYCQKAVALPKPGRTESCPQCGHDLHCCYQCRFYDPSYNNECREPQAERVVEKEKANFCDYFVFDPQIKVKAVVPEGAKAKWEALFKKK